MSTPPASIAQLLTVFPEDGSAPPPPPTDETSTTEAAVFISYFNNEQYNNSDGHREAAPRYENYDFAPSSIGAAPPSPPNPSVSIPPALAALPTPANAPYLISIPSTANPNASMVDYDRGEMGGKRRKQVHERAGYKEWKDIDGMPPGKRRKDGEYDFDGDADGQGSSRQVDDERIFPPGTGEITEPTGGEQPEDKAKRSKITKELRAEQNRKAQQIFRRKREQRIKQLELDSVALNGFKERTAQAEAKLLEMALELEAKSIEAAGLRRALAAAGAAGVSVTRPDGSLVLSQAEWDSRDTAKGSAAATEAACDALTKASREVAKFNRQRRDGMGQQQA